MLATFTLLTAAALAANPTAQVPVRQQPENPHYVEFRGQPTILVTSGEHYGAVLNLDFDFMPYLDALQRDGLNLTRTFAGTYREVHGSFNIPNNTLAPREGRFQSPWVKKGEKFDLDHFDPAYFERLKTFLTEAGRRGIVVELSLFCPLYGEELWEVNPMNARNNVNGVGNIPREEVYTLKHPDLLERQLAFVREVVSQLRDFDNLYYEICNEPYFGGVTLDWQARVAQTIAEAEKDFPARHLIAQNIANEKAKVENPNPSVSILNFHYADPAAASENYGLGRVLGDDETGFDGLGDRTYRTEAWRFLLAGGGIFSNLDYSFTPDHEDGTAKVEAPTPGGGGPELRKQLATLKNFLEGFEFLRMKPAPETIAGGVPQGASASVLAESGRQYAVYLDNGQHAELRLKLPAGAYHVEWLDPRNGSKLNAQDLDHAGGEATLKSPDYAEDIALKIVRR